MPVQEYFRYQEPFEELLKKKDISLVMAHANFVTGKDLKEIRLQNKDFNSRHHTWELDNNKMDRPYPEACTKAPNSAVEQMPAPSPVPVPEPTAPQALLGPETGTAVNDSLVKGLSREIEEPIHTKLLIEADLNISRTKSLEDLEMKKACGDDLSHLILLLTRPRPSRP